MKPMLRIALVVATLASAALVLGALQSPTASAAPAASICVTVPAINPVTGVLSCVDQFGNVVPVVTPAPAPASPLPGCMTGPVGVVFCPPGTPITVQPQVVFSRSGQQFFFVSPFQSLFFQRCFMTVFGRVFCF